MKSYLKGVYYFADRYIWYLFPNATNRLYGYQPQANQSFESEVLPSDSRVTTDDNIDGIWVPAGEEVNLGQFSASCLADTGVCQNFTVSFLFKINGSISENETVDVIHQMPLADAEYLFQFSVHNNGSHYLGGATVARGHNRTDLTGVIQQRDRWIHVAIVYTKADYLELFLNGTKEQSNATSVAFNGSIQSNMTLGSSNSSNGFFVSYLQIIEVAISQADVTALKDQSFNQGRFLLFHVISCPLHCRRNLDGANYWEMPTNDRILENKTGCFLIIFTTGRG